MKLNQEKKARKCIKTLAVKNDISLREIAEKIGIQPNTLNVNMTHETMKMSTFVNVIQAINNGYKVNIHFNTPEEYHIQVIYHDTIQESFYIHEVKPKKPIIMNDNRSSQLDIADGF